MDSILLTNIPHDCNEYQLQNWIEARGVRILGLRLIADLVSGTSTSFARAQLSNHDDAHRAVHVLDGQRLNTRVIRVKALRLTETSRRARVLKASA
jgi:hypothetical protein